MKEFKIGDRVDHYKVVVFSVPDRIKVDRQSYVVHGDENGEPLCLARTGTKYWHDDTMDLHEVALTEVEAIRRWRSEKLQQTLRYEHQAKESRKGLCRPIVLSDEKSKALPDAENPQLRVRIEPGGSW